MAILKRVVAVVVWLTAGSAWAHDTFVLAPEYEPLPLYDAVFAFRINHQDYFYHRQVIPPERSLGNTYWETDLRVGLVPLDESRLWFRGVELSFGTAMGINFPSTPVTRFGLATGFLPFGSEAPTLGVSLNTTPTGMDLNATYANVTVGHRIEGWRLSWVGGFSVGYQEAGDGVSPFVAAVAGASLEPVDNLSLNLEYTGRFASGVLNAAVGYVIADVVQVYVTVPLNHDVDRGTIDPPLIAFGLGLWL